MEGDVSRHGALNKMTSPKLLLYLACLLLGETAQTPDTSLTSPPPQDERSFVSAVVGAEVTLRCVYKGQIVRLYWFKQSLGQKPRLISAVYKFEGNGKFYNEFENNPRFILDTQNLQNNLKIVDLQLNDSATYYCAGAFAYYVEFQKGITVTVRGSGYSIQASVVQSGPGTVPPGRSVTLSCTAHSSCEGQHAVSWFKSSSAPHPGLIYTHGGRKDQCQREPNAQTRVCVFDLPLSNVTGAHAGTYHCAVSSCGRMLFGNGTKLDVKDESGRPLLVYFLSGALTLTTTASVVLTFCVYKMNKRNQTEEHQARFAADPTCHQGEDNLHYAAIRTNRTERFREERRNPETECVYSSVKT